MSLRELRFAYKSKKVSVKGAGRKEHLTCGSKRFVYFAGIHRRQDPPGKIYF